MAKAKPHITAKMIVDLLATKHSGDVFVPECKNGSTTTANANLLRMDAWAMNRSWSKPWTHGYEVKVTRRDFIGDDKWPLYLRYCNRFAFVCPPRLIQPEELPAGVGLFWTSINCKRLYVKRQPPHREVEIPEDLWRYVLMCRATMGEEFVQRTNREIWEEWLKEEKIDSAIGRRVSKRLRERIKEEVVEAMFENGRLRTKTDNLEPIARLVKECDIRYYEQHDEKSLRKRIAEARRVIPPSLCQNLREMVKAIDEYEATMDNGVAAGIQHVTGKGKPNA